MAMGFDRTADEVLAGTDLAGRTICITGGTSGIGTETARAMGARGARIIFTARDSTKAETTLAALRDTVPQGHFEALVMDLGSFGSIRDAAAKLLGGTSRIDVLINNAGVMNTPFGFTEDGFETQFGVDHLGHFLFTLLLVPALVAAAPARVISLTSSSHIGGDVCWDDINWTHTPYDKFRAYSSAKTANMLFAVELDRRLSVDGVRAYGVHPGVIATNLHRYMTEDDIAAVRARVASRGGIRIKSVAHGAASTVWAATTPDLERIGGVYIEDCKLATPHIDGLSGFKPYALDGSAACRLWTMSEEMTGERL